ncbi:MAG: hypothetical protein ABSF43_08820 [Rectinemataceae bacterium]|jgi:hypothetical protein
MSPYYPRPSLALRLACALLASSMAAASEGGAALRGSAYSSLCEDELAMRISLAGSSSYLGLGLEAKGEDRGLAACFSVESADEADTGIVAGPGSVSGITRVLVDPTSPTSLSQGPLVELDKSLESRTSILGLRAGPVSLFALAKGKGVARDLEAAAAGLSYGISAPGGSVSAIAAASYGKAAASASGWRPDPSVCPASNCIDRPCFSAALVAERHDDRAASLLALAASHGRLAGPGIAFRLESREILGPVRLRLAAGAAGSSFRELVGPRQERLLDASAEARIAMRRASSLTASLETQAKGESLLYAPLWGRKGGLSLVLPTGGGAGSYVETRFEADSPSEGTSCGSWSMALVRKTDERPASSSATLGGSLRWDSVLSGVNLSLKTELAGKDGLPALGLDLSLDLFDRGRLESPVLATGALRVEFPFGREASLALDVALPEKGVILAPSCAEVHAARPVFCIRYRASVSGILPSIRSRPRSRISVFPKASSIAQRAAS